MLFIVIFRLRSVKIGKVERNTMVTLSLLLQIFLAPQLDFLIDTIGQLRLETYKDYPYFYYGTLELEREYLQLYNESKDGMVAQAEIDGKLAGVLTGKPLCAFEQAAQFFEDAGYDPKEYYYFGEIIVIPQFRRLGIARKLFAMLEQKIRELGYKKVCFMIIDEQEIDSLKPENYEDPTLLSMHLGYSKMNIVMSHDWPTIQKDGTVKNNTHDMVFWEKQLE